jgi:hypothetical protein
MPSRALIFKQMPWTGGLNTSLDEATIPAHQLTVADNVVFATSGSRKKREGIKHNWDVAATEVFTVTLPAAASITTGQYWTCSSPTVNYYVWYNKDAGGGDPAPATKTAIEVAIVTGDTAAQVATKTAAAVAATGSALVFSATADSATVTVTTLVAGACTNAANVDVGGTPTFTTTRDGISTSASIVGLHDYWFGSTTRSQRIVAVTSDRKVYVYNAGTRTELTVAGTAWSGTLTSCSMTTFNNKVIIAVDGSTNVVKYWDGNSASSVDDLPGTPPLASVVGQHLGRLVLNDKGNPDRAHYSPTHDHTQWNGAGDSGAVDIGVGDGDPIGITAFFPTFKGELFIGKRTKLYRVSGYAPETLAISKVSDSIGVASHNSITPVDQDDVMWVSEKGVHSLAATANYGDFEASYVSQDIQKTFSDEFDRSRLKYVWGAYLNNINSVAFSFTEESSLGRTLTNTSVNNTVYLYNVVNKAWYRWPDLPCQSLIVAGDSDKRRFYFGSHTGRVSKSFNGTNYDISSSGTNTAISFRVVTGQIFPDGDAYTSKAFKKFILFYKPSGTHTVSATIKVDNIRANAENSLNFSETGSSALLGSTFTLGTSELGYEVLLGPYTRTVDGVGRGIKLTIEQNTIDEAVEIQGFGLVFEPAGTPADIRLS